MQFTVTVTGIDQTVTVGFQTGDGSATADDDYTRHRDPHFHRERPTRTISVVTIDDTIREADETFSVTLSDPAGATILPTARRRGPSPTMTTRRCRRCPSPMPTR